MVPEETAQAGLDVNEAVIVLIHRDFLRQVTLCKSAPEK
ncbi:MAG: hypothetical protein ACI8ZX_000220 [Planctomycetota bacterium]|jgi:hypothetical protein